MKQNKQDKYENDNGFIQLKKDEKEWQDSIGNRLIEESYKSEGARLVYENQFENIINAMNISEGFSILEIGCGRGQLVHKIATTFSSKKIQLFGLDLSSNLVEVKQKYSEDRANWIIADGEKLPFLDRTFHVVIFNGSLHHMPNFNIALNETFRVIKVNGSIILYEPVSTIFSRTIHHLLDPFIFKKVQYESPIDVCCKDNFRLQLLHNSITNAGFTYTKTWHDFLTYPLTGCYAGSYFSRKPMLLKFCLHIEKFIHGLPLMKNICNLFCWRVLLSISRK